MVPPPVLRDRRRLTRLLILRELLTRPESPLKDVAGTLGVTVQAVSHHVLSLRKEGLVAQTDGRRVTTPAGIQFLQDGFRDLKKAVDTALEPLAVIDVTSAFAKSRIRRGEKVGLFMEEGDLVARAGQASSSVGRAVEAADVGDEVLVRDLRGVVDLRPGTLWIVRLPGPEEGGSRTVNTRKLSAFLGSRKVDPRRVGADGTGAKAVVRRLGLPLHFEFAPARASFHAAELGVTVALFVTRDRLRDVLESVDALNAATLHRVPVEILESPAP